MSTITSTFQGNMPMNGSDTKAPSLPSPNGRPASSMAMRAFFRAVSSWVPKRGMSRVNVPSRSVS